MITKEFVVISTTASKNTLVEGVFSTQEEAETYIGILFNQYGPVSEQDLDDKVMKFNIRVDFVLPLD